MRISPFVIASLLMAASISPPLLATARAQSATTVKVTASGAGFEMSATAQALSAGYVGQQARVKLSNGKMISGQVGSDGSVEVNL